MKKPALSLKLAFAERKGLLVLTRHAEQALANLPKVDFEPNELIEGSHPFLIDPIPINEKASLVTKAGICREEGIARTHRACRTGPRESPYGRFRTQ
ncbi:hypothetical protein EF405_20810 [Cyclobacteriaceae bacterium YHN15]|nr:hypothetical protein EF405_20810 [Cyclobacteriaceae bacterium YHN15]